MNEQEKNRERTSWRRWHIFNTLSYFLGFRFWRGILFGHKLPKGGKDEPPMIALDRLATKGLMKPEPIRITKPLHMEYMVSLAKSVVSLEDTVSDQQRTLLEQFLSDHLPEQEIEQAKSEFIEFFHEFDAKDRNLRNTCYLAKNSLSRTLIVQLVEFLFGLEHASCSETDNRHHVDRIAEYLDLSPADIRRARQDGIKLVDL